MGWELFVRDIGRSCHPDAHRRHYIAFVNPVSDTMRISATVPTFALVALHLGVVAALRHPKEPSSNDEAGSVIPNSFIIEYAPGSRSRVRRHIEARSEVDDDIKIIEEFDSSIFSGATVETVTFTKESLQELPEVVNVWVNTEIKLDLTEPQSITLQDDPSYSSAYHSVTGVDKIHKQGIFGKGVKIGVIDSGIWYKHEALGGGFGEGFKVAGGYDFIGNGNYSSSSYGDDKAPSEDPLDMTGHGTQVAGVIAGKSGANFIGVAPEATLYAYKIFGTKHNTYASVVLEAFLAAEKDGVDIINFCVGSPYGWADHVYSAVASRLVDKGIVVVASPGNNGEHGPFYMGSSAGGKDVIAVAAVESEFVAASPFKVTFSGGRTIRLGYIPSGPYFPSTLIDWPIVALNTNTIYGGRIVIDGSNGEQLSVPYAGVGADLRDTISDMQEAGWPKSASTTEKIPIDRKASYSFDLTDKDFPKIYSKLIWGTRELRWDIFDASWNEADWTYPPVEGENGYIGSVETYDWDKADGIDTNNPKNFEIWPLTSQRRQIGTKYAEFWWFGKLANGSKIEPGEYQWRFAALRPFGDPTRSDHWSAYIKRITITGQY
ncbi:Minor extracellular protease vpr [Colletotrichum tanaceti]|uniref:Minor extracellular protease vpr n=1 Tax=Colletotrichum tanaceti TaxID=1306861 RepID=A0A4U6XRW7_9PEZI|nr:Minor extracellular protease vpr [Colletotrichum tanaceti]TKW58582.1 Minor extracellular protease vpr [Colletotrichum tanaceti]